MRYHISRSTLLIPFLRSRERSLGEARADGLMCYYGKPDKAEQHVGAPLFPVLLHFKLEQKGFNTGLHKLKGRVKNEWTGELSLSKVHPSLMGIAGCYSLKINSLGPQCLPGTPRTDTFWFNPVPASPQSASVWPSLHQIQALSSQHLLPVLIFYYPSSHSLFSSSYVSYLSFPCSISIPCWPNPSHRTASIADCKPILLSSFTLLFLYFFININLQCQLQIFLLLF